MRILKQIGMEVGDGLFNQRLVLGGPADGELVGKTV